MFVFPLSLHIKEFVQPKMSLNNRESGKRDGGDRGAGGRVGQQAVIFKVWLGLVRFGRDREIEGKDRDTER
jgi:hypothetical protein